VALPDLLRKLWRSADGFVTTVILALTVFIAVHLVFAARAKERVALGHLTASVELLVLGVLHVSLSSWAGHNFGGAPHWLVLRLVASRNASDHDAETRILLVRWRVVQRASKMRKFYGSAGLEAVGAEECFLHLLFGGVHERRGLEDAVEHLFENREEHVVAWRAVEGTATVSHGAGSQDDWDVAMASVVVGRERIHVVGDHLGSRFVQNTRV
jgi:hypothetical protein